MASVSEQDFSQTFYEKLKCYICESRLRAGKHHWYKCFAFHLVCQDCKEVKGNKKCSCTKPIASEYCEVIEALLNTAKMQFKCENLIRGCQESSDKENIILHQTECIYRLVKCPRPSGCGLKVPFHELLDHMKPDCFLGKDLHGFYNECAYNYDRKKPDGAYFIIKIILENKIFFSTMKLKDGVIHHWIHFYGSPIEAKNYSYTLEYYNDAKTPTVTCSFSDQVVPIDETAGSIIENGNCFAISRKVLEKNLFRNRTLPIFKFSVKITNLKEEVKDENVESGVSDVDE